MRKMPSVVHKPKAPKKRAPQKHPLEADIRKVIASLTTKLLELAKVGTAPILTITVSQEGKFLTFATIGEPGLVGHCERFLKSFFEQKIAEWNAPEPKGCEGTEPTDDTIPF